MSRLFAVIALACAFVISACTMNPAMAGPKQTRADSQALAFCAADASYRLVCPGAAGRVKGHARRKAVDAHGNAVSAREAAAGARRGLCRVGTAAGEILIACGLERQMIGFIADAVARGFKGRVLRPGRPCPSIAALPRRGLRFAQRGWNKTVRRPMYRVADLAAKWGLRDGWIFGDCGHIDAGGG